MSLKYFLSFLHYNFKELPKEYYLKEGKDFIKEFKEKVSNFDKEKEISRIVSSEENIEFFAKKLTQLWKNYLKNIAKIRVLREFIHVNPYYKIKFLKEFIKDHLKLNEELYKATMVEKEVIERAIFKYLNEKEISEFFKFNKNFFSKFSEIFSDFKIVDSKAEFYLYTSEKLLEDKKLNEFFEDFGFKLDEIRIKSNNLEKSSNKKVEKEDQVQNKKNKLFNLLRNLFYFDNYLEKGWIELDIVLEDLKFYVDLAERFSTKKSFEALFKILEEREKVAKRKFIYDIPKYNQTADSCGATCLLNAYSYFYQVKPTIKLERFIEGKVKVPGFPNNLPSSLALTSIEDFGMPAKFFAEMKTFYPLYLKEKIENVSSPLLKKFREDYEKLKKYNAIENYDNIKPENLEEKIKKGSMIAFVRGKGPILHYNMIIGYKKTKSGNYFYVFDPMNSVYLISYKEILGYMRNDRSLWGVEFYSPDRFLYKDIKNSKNE